MTNKFLNLKYQEKLFFKLLKKFPSADQDIIKHAYEIAKKQHAGQIRIEGIPYIIHPLRMANYLMERLKLVDADFIVTALLHDTIEDGNLTGKDIDKEFDQKVVKLVKALTRPSPPDETEEQKMINKPKKFKQLLQNGSDVLLVKAVDLLDNLKSWPYIDKNDPAISKFPRWQEEANDYYLEITKKAHPKLYQDMKKNLPKIIKKITP